MIIKITITFTQQISEDNYELEPGETLLDAVKRVANEDPGGQVYEQVDFGNNLSYTIEEVVSEEVKELTTEVTDTLNLKGEIG